MSRIILIAIFSLFILLSGCSGDDTRTGSPPTDEVPTDPDPGTDPGANATPVERWGRLSVDRANLVNRRGEPVQLRGISSHGLQWFPHFMNENTLRWLRDDWQANVVRAAMYTVHGGYIENPAVKDKVVEVVEAAIDLGLYVIIDWHILNDGNPNQHKAAAIEFFREMATRFGDYPNVIYEIANEPNGHHVTWDREIRSYAVDVVGAIREIDSDNVIIVGTGTWSQDIHHAADDPLDDPNVMYALHFYAGTHGDELRSRIDYARERGAAIFVSEWGVSQATGDGGVFEQETRAWIDFLNARDISWVNWNLSDKVESSAALAPGANTHGQWPDEQLSPSGRLVRELMRAP